MKEKLKKRIKIKINKIYIENMSKDEHGNSNEPKEEDFSWTKENNLDLKKKYLNLPLDIWKELINKHIKSKDCSYQEMVNVILKYNIFKLEDEQKKFRAEINGTNNTLIASFYKDINDYINDNPNIVPDFIVKNIESTKLLDIINNRKDMFRYDSNFIKFENYKSINIVGEIKINSDLINARNQRDRYIEYCKKMNKRNKNKGVYYLILYFFDQNFKNFWEKTFFNNNPIIIGYIPQLSNEKYFDKQKEIKTEIENLIKEQKKRENIELKIKEEKINFSINESEKSINKLDEIPETKESKHLSEGDKNINNNRSEKDRNLKEANEQQNLLEYNSQEQRNLVESEENLFKEKERVCGGMINNKKKNLEQIDANILKIKNEIKLQKIDLKKEKNKKEKEEKELNNLIKEMDYIKLKLDFISLKKAILMKRSINLNVNLLGKKRNDENE